MARLLVFLVGVLVLGLIGFVLWILLELVRTVLIWWGLMEHEPEVLAWKLRRKAVKADWNGKHETALAFYEEYLKLCPDDEEVQERRRQLLELGKDTAHS